MKTETLQLIHEAAELKAHIDELTDKYKVMKSQIAEEVEMPAGKQTATVDAGEGLKCKIAKREAYTWDQTKLNNARAAIGDDIFLTLFTFEWKPQGKRYLDAWFKVAPDESRQLIVDAMTVKESVLINFERENQHAV